MRRIKDIAFLVVLMTAATISWSQDWKRTQNWYFGDSAGLSFATDPPTVLNNGRMYALEGCATISDTGGNLLFYTNGIIVWNKLHQVMLNGTGLTSNQSYTQAALIVPQPGNDSIYFIFTTGYLRYSVVNIKREGGLGEVVVKNTDLILSGTEKLAATHHANGHDVWISTHGKDNNHFFSYLVTDKGVVNCPVVSKVGSVMGIPASSGAGELEFSYSGKYAAVSFFSLKFFELLEFDNAKGQFKNPITVNLSPGYPYGICFSSNEKYIYVTERDRFLVQYNIVHFHHDSINNSRTQISSLGTFDIQGLQIMPSGEIVVTNPGSDSMGTIRFPNEPAPQCQYESKYISLGVRTGTHNLPNFISSYFYRPEIDIKYTTNCINDSFVFFAKALQVLVSPSWQLFKQGNLIFSNSGQTLNYVFPDTGTYIVQLIEQGDTVRKDIFIEPRLELGSDTVICNTNEFNLTLPDNFRCLQWQDGADSQTYRVTENGVYYVSAFNNRGCLLSDTVRVKLGNIQSPLIIRNGDSLFTNSGYTYTWLLNGGPIQGNTNAIRVIQTGNYQVEITDSIGCTALSAIFPITLLSVEKIGPHNIRIFPNPLMEGQSLNIEYDLGIHSIEVYDANGRQTYASYDLNTPNVSIPGLSRGIYYIRINQTYTAKININ